MARAGSDAVDLFIPRAAMSETSSRSGNVSFSPVPGLDHEADASSIAARGGTGKAARTLGAGSNAVTRKFQRNLKSDFGWG